MRQVKRNACVRNQASQRLHGVTLTQQGQHVKTFQLLATADWWGEIHHLRTRQRMSRTRIAQYKSIMPAQREGAV
jgi:hypothetical protein